MARMALPLLHNSLKTLARACSRLWSALRTHRKRLLVWITGGTALFLLGGYALFSYLDARCPFPVHAFSPPAATMVVDRSGHPLRFFLPLDGRWRFPVSLEEVSPELVQAVLASEDRYFYYHPGVNPISILRAAWTNLTAGRVVLGASTIPMQLARLAEPKDRTFTAKMQEAFRALQLEGRFSKDALLELYLNMAPFGGNIVGAGAASYFYFGKRPGRLSLGEAALLTIIPRAPKGYDPFIHPGPAKRERDQLLDIMAQRGVISRADAAAAKLTQLPVKMRRPPLRAPHLCRELHTAHALPGSPESLIIRSTIDLRVQNTAEAILHRRIGGLRAQGLENAAFVVMDTASRELLAMVGAESFLDDERHGQINAARIKRSPGSALKPFLYALAMEQGVIVPESCVLDIPTEFAGYVATNYDDQYRGRVTVQEALAQSLNAPAVRLLAQVGVQPYLDLLHRLGLQTLDKPASYYGLPLVLGAGEVRLDQLVNAYATLATGGVMLPLRDVLEVSKGGAPWENPQTPPAVPAGEAKGGGKHLLSPEACYLTGNILSTVRRTDMPQAWNLARDVPAVAWKTGTSFGHRDAWAIGYSGRLAIGVWVGNVDGHPVPGISGAHHAGPLLFDLFRALEPDGARLPEPDFLNLDEVEVCADSRELATPLCKERVRITVIPDVTQLQRDTLHRRIFVDSETGERLEGSCLAKRPHVAKVVRVEPPELLAWQWSRGNTGGGQLSGGLPPLSKLCNDVPSEGVPRIVSPSSRTPYRIRADAPREYQKLALVAQISGDTSRLFWYQDGQLVASGAPSKRLFLALEPGEHRLVLLDSQGRQDSVTYRVVGRE